MFFSIKQVAAHYSRSPDTIRRWVNDKKFPPPIRLPSRRPVWPSSVLETPPVLMADGQLELNFTVSEVPE